MGVEAPPEDVGTVRQYRQHLRQRAITETVMKEGAVRIERLAERFGVSVMTVHRDLDELESRGLLRKDRGVATATSTALVESSDVYRSSRQLAEKEALAGAAMNYVETGQAIILDDSTTTLHLVPYLSAKAPITVITNTMTIMEQLRGSRGITLLGVGGKYYSWCSSFMGRMAIETIESLRADLLIMSTAAITDDIAFHQTLETVDVKRAMFASARKRILLADHTKFDKRALHALQPLSDFDVIIVDAATDREHVARLRDKVETVVVAKKGVHPR